MQIDRVKLYGYYSESEPRTKIEKKNLNWLSKESSQSQTAKVIELNNNGLYNSPIKTNSSG